MKKIISSMLLMSVAMSVWARNEGAWKSVAHDLVNTKQQQIWKGQWGQWGQCVEEFGVLSSSKGAEQSVTGNEQVQCRQEHWARMLPTMHRVTGLNINVHVQLEGKQFDWNVGGRFGADQKNWRAVPVNSKEPSGGSYAKVHPYQGYCSVHLSLGADKGLYHEVQQLEQSAGVKKDTLLNPRLWYQMELYHELGHCMYGWLQITGNALWGVQDLEEPKRQALGGWIEHTNHGLWHAEAFADAFALYWMRQRHPSVSSAMAAQLQSVRKAQTQHYCVHSKVPDCQDQLWRFGVQWLGANTVFEYDQAQQLEHWQQHLEQREDSPGTVGFVDDEHQLMQSVEQVRQHVWRWWWQQYSAKGVGEKPLAAQMQGSSAKQLYAQLQSSAAQYQMHWQMRLWTAWLQEGLWQVPWQGSEQQVRAYWQHQYEHWSEHWQQGAHFGAWQYEFLNADHTQKWLSITDALMEQLKSRYGDQWYHGATVRQKSALVHQVVHQYVQQSPDWR